MFTNYQDSIIGTVANVKNKILASVISSETNQRIIGYFKKYVLQENGKNG